MVEVDDFEGGEQDGLMKVLNTKQRQIDLLQKKIEKMEKDNDKFDKMGKMKEQGSIDFEFDLEGSSFASFDKRRPRVGKRRKEPEVQSPRFEINFVVSSCKGK